MKENLNNITEQFLKRIRVYEGLDEQTNQMIDDTLSNLEKIKETYLSQYNGKYFRLNNTIGTTIYKVNGIQNAGESFSGGYYIDGTAITRKFNVLRSVTEYEISNGIALHISAIDWENIEEVSKEDAEQLYNEYMNVINESNFIE